MYKRILTFLLAVTIMLPIFGVSAESPHLVIIDFPVYIRPGKTEMFQFEAAHEGTGSLSLEDASGKPLFMILDGLAVASGLNTWIWNGYGPSMQPVREGDYRLRIRSEEDLADHAVHIGPPSPQITQLLLQDAKVTPGERWGLTVNVNMPGELAVVFHVADQHHEIYHESIPSGVTQVTWDGMLKSQIPPPGRHTLSVVFLDETGFAANQQHITLEVTAPPTTITPDAGLQPGITPETVTTPQPSDLATTAEPFIPENSHYTVPTREEVPEEQIGADFWRLPVGDYNEEAIWKVMMQPMTVLWGKDQRETYKLRAAKDDSTKRDNIVGEIGYESQGVHVIEQWDDGWSLVEVYNSSYGPDNRTRRGYGDTDALIRGYVRTKELKVIAPREDYGILIDKLKQRMYIFQDGKIFSELLISTGVPTKQQPWNETPSGEFFMVSRTGDFNAGNLVCRMAMRINGGALIHEVPYILNESTGHWDYSSQEAQLGKKASHGCIRVQRLNNAEGVNMTWLWNNIKVNTKVLVWDDDNRYYEYPEDSLAIYYNPIGGKFYHLDQNCRSIKDRYLPLEGSMLYSELDNPEFSKLTPCAHCNPPLKSSQIDRINKANGY